MDRLLKPQVLNVDPGDPLAFKAYKHWIKTFNAFAEAAQQSLRTAGQSENAPNREIDKLALLTCIYGLKFTNSSKVRNLRIC